jgi:hypothetical protein
VISSGPLAPVGGAETNVLLGKVVQHDSFEGDDGWAEATGKAKMPTEEISNIENREARSRIPTLSW